MTSEKHTALIWGAKGHAKVLRPVIEEMGHTVVAIYDRDSRVPSPFPDIQRLRDEAALVRWIEDTGRHSLFAVAIGGSNGLDRVEVGAYLRKRGLNAPILVHSRGWLAKTAKVGEGSQVLAMAGVSECAELGKYCIVNTNASVDHDCILGDGVHIMPGATVAGEVTIENFVTVGSNATILPRLRIGEGAFIGAGAVVTKDVAPGAVMIGVPSRRRY